MIPQGDSGGPLVLQRSDGRWELVGTVSHGIKCAHPYLPGVYMRTTYYKPWLQSITGVNWTRRTHTHTQWTWESYTYIQNTNIYKNIYSNSAEHNFTRTVKIPLTRSIFHVMCEAAIDTSLQSIMLKCRWMKAQRSIFLYSLMFFFLFFVVYHLGDFLLCSFFSLFYFHPNDVWRMRNGFIPGKKKCI